MRRIDTDDQISDGLDALCRLDPRLAPVRAAAGPVPLRRRPSGFASLAEIVVAQQVSRASAEAIMGRLAGRVAPLTPEGLLAAGEPALVAAGLSRAKQRTLRALADAVVAGGLDLDALCALETEEALAHLTLIHGIGAWTAEVYLLTAAGHADVFPARDVALQASVARAFTLAARPNWKALAIFARNWAPWRSVATRLFWAHYARHTARPGMPVTYGAPATPVSPSEA